VILVSEGFTVVLPPAAYQVSPLGAMFAGNPTTGANPDQELRGQMDLDLRMREVYRAANRFNTSIYSLDPRGLSPFESDIADPDALRGGPEMDRAMMRSAQGTLRDLALETDGRVVMNRNSLAEGLGEVLSDTRHYYLLGYTTPSEPDGKFHEIRVRVKRPGVDVRARKGFWALSFDNYTRAISPRTPDMPKPFQQALATLASPVKAARAVRTWVGTEQGSAGKTRVTLVWEPVTAPSGSPEARREAPGRVSLLASTDRGDLVYRGRSEPPAPAAPGSAAAPAAPQRLTFDAPPGKLELRLTVEGANGGTIDTDQRTIDVPDLAAAGAALSTPRVYRARTARDFQIIAKDPAAVPIAAREFSRTERLLVRFDVYAAGGETPQPTAAILNRSGQKMSDVPVVPATAGGTHQIDVGLNSVAAGEYVLEISVKGATGEEASQLVAFRVGA
jgi:hypothetical protein